MKFLRFLFALMLFAAIFHFCKGQTDLKLYAPTESYPYDSNLGTISAKRALIVIAHDDDMSAMSGTISKLNKEGWEIGVVSLTQSPERDAAQIKACKSILDTVMFVPLRPEEFRNDLGTNKTRYDAVPKDSFDVIFSRKVIQEAFAPMIRRFNPTVIFTLDHEIGGYGHPEHVLVSQMVLEMVTSKQISPEYIYQSVYTDHMEKTIMQRHSERMKSWGFPDDGWEKAKQAYQVEGMPEPSVQIDIRSEAKPKMRYLRSYNKRERKTMGFYIPGFEEYDAKTYFSVFDREFFRVIDLP